MSTTLSPRESTTPRSDTPTTPLDTDMAVTQPGVAPKWPVEEADGPTKASTTPKQNCDDVVGVEKVGIHSERADTHTTEGEECDGEFADEEERDQFDENEDDLYSDLGTPVGAEGGGFGDIDEYASHCFVGPSAGGGKARVLHGFRKLDLQAKPPRYVSTAADAELHKNRAPSRTSSSSHTSASPNSSEPTGPGPLTERSYSAFDQGLNTFSVTFTETKLGFKLNVLVTPTKELVVEVANVEKNSPASRAGIVSGDLLINVNGNAIEANNEEKEVLKMISQASHPRSMVFLRPDCDVADIPQSKSLGFLDKKPKTRYGRLSSAMSYGSSLMASKLKRKKAVVHADTYCAGCSMEPIVGKLWTCNECPNTNLCNSCYDNGVHGFDTSEDAQMLEEAVVRYKLQKKCKRFTTEFLHSLQHDVCKGRPDKLEYMGGWIADIVTGTATSKITVRGIEIPSLSPASRQRFVGNLMPLVSNRTDIEVNIEWLPDDSERASMDADLYRMSVAVSHVDPEPAELEKLRIWISDKKARTASPFP